MGQQTNTTRDLFRLFGHSTAPPSVKMYLHYITEEGDKSIDKPMNL